MRAKRSLGQNFLVDPNLQRKIVDAVEPGPDDTVLEIGPGQGALTGFLADRAGRVVAVELDDDLAADLSARFAPPGPGPGTGGAAPAPGPGGRSPTVEIVHADFLDWDPGDLLAADLKVVGNIPYNITSPILFRVLTWRPLPERLVVMVQKEVGDRLRAEAGEKAYGALTVGVRAVASVEKLFDVGRQAFRPVPNVDSTVLLLRPRRRAASPDTGQDATGTAADAVGPERLRSLTRAAFGMRRKQLQKILRTAPGYGLPSDRGEAVLASVGVDPRARPETLDPDTFVELAAALGRLGYPLEGETP